MKRPEIVVDVASLWPWDGPESSGVARISEEQLGRLGNTPYELAELESTSWARLLLRLWC